MGRSYLIMSFHEIKGEIKDFEAIIAKIIEAKQKINSTLKENVSKCN